ncbi:MAG TPA: HAD-IA family hydrolase [Actinomycetota bacterium]|nr:HAD-IA family hydrolase [Actinomycetota bacterium]
MPEAIDHVFLDIGGVLYDDRVYAEAWRRALREAGGTFTDAAFEDEYAACRAAQDRSFRVQLATAFLGPDADVRALEARAARYWQYPPSALHTDVVPTLTTLRDTGYRLGVIANQPSQVRAAMERDGLVPFFEVWGVSDDLGLHKPDPALFHRTLELAGVEGGRSVMVGDRLDYDMRPARAAGMHTVWLLRGEAPDDPTPAQLAEPDVVIEELLQLPDVLDELS